MKRIKYLFILPVLLAPLIFSPFVNALEIKTLTSSYISSIDFSVQNPNGNKTNQPINRNVYSPFYSVTVQPNQVTRIGNLALYLESPKTLTKGYKWDVTVYFYTSLQQFRGSYNNLIPTFLCPPSGLNNVRIDDCEVEYHDTTSSLIESTPLTLDSTTGAASYGFESKIFSYYAMKVSGHITEDMTVDHIALNGPLMNVYNANTAYAFEMDYLWGVSSARFYTLVESEDKAALELEEQNQKDDQDRQNAQNQQSQASSDASDSAAAISSASDSLLIVIGNFINIVTHPPARDCKIDGDMGHMDLGQIDLCQLSPPPAIQTIATLLIIGFIIPFAYGVISTILNLLKGATQ